MKKLSVFVFMLLFSACTVLAQIDEDYRLEIVCDVGNHFLFEVRNSGGSVVYIGCYDAENRGPHQVTYILTREMADGVGRPDVGFTQWDAND